MGCTTGGVDGVGCSGVEGVGCSGVAGTVVTTVHTLLLSPFVMLTLIDVPFSFVADPDVALPLLVLSPLVAEPDPATWPFSLMISKSLSFVTEQVYVDSKVHSLFEFGPV